MSLPRKWSEKMAAKKSRGRRDRGHERHLAKSYATVVKDGVRQVVAVSVLHKSQADGWKRVE